MSLVHDNFIQTNNLLQKAKLELAKANSLVAKSITIDNDGSTAADPNSGDWATLATAIGTAITAVDTALADVYFYPDQIDD